MRETHLRLSVIGIVLLAACSSPSLTNPSDLGSRWIWRENCEGAYPAQERSPYVLPYEPGQSFVSGGTALERTPATVRSNTPTTL